FNPVTGTPGSFQESKTRIDRVLDGYQDRRNPKAKSLVGVMATVTLMNYLWSERDRTPDGDFPEHDKVKVKLFVYDLELDDTGVVVGGEWGNRARENGGKVEYVEQPDFIWMAPLNQLPYSRN